VAKKKGTLTEKQKTFVRNLPTAGSATEAARIAGYSEPDVYSSRLVNDSRYKHVQDAIRRQEERLDKKVGLTLEDKKEKLRKIVKDGPDREAMTAIDLDNKMEAVYLQRTQSEDIDPSDEQLLQKYIKKFNRLGYDVIKRKDRS